MKAVFRDSCLVFRDPETEAGGTAVAPRRLAFRPCLVKSRDSCFAMQKQETEDPAFMFSRDTRPESRQVGAEGLQSCFRSRAGLVGSDDAAVLGNQKPIRTRRGRMPSEWSLGIRPARGFRFSGFSFLHHETRDTNTNHGFSGARLAEPSPSSKVFTNHETRNTKHESRLFRREAREPRDTNHESRLFRREARRAKPEFQGFHETRNTRHETRLF